MSCSIDVCRIPQSDAVFPARRLAIAGALFGWLVHRFVRLIAHYEAPISAFIVAVFELQLTTGSLPRAQRRTGGSRTIARALLLSRQGRKRGPPRPVFG